MGLAAGMRQQAAGIEFFDGNAAAAVGEKVHGESPAEIRQIRVGANECAAPRLLGAAPD